MKSVFQGWLSIVIAVGFSLTFFASWFIHSKLSRDTASELLRVQLSYACKKIDMTQKALQSITEQSNAGALLKTRTFARILEADPSIIQKPAELKKIQELLAVDELHVSDEKGILIASMPQEQEFVHYDMSSRDQSRAFMPALTNPDFSLVQKPQLNGSQQKLVQYAGVARKDKPGIIQIGYCPERIAEAQKLADVNSIAKGFRIGKTGGLSIQRIAESEKLVPAGKEFFLFNKDSNGVPCAMMTISHNGYLLTGKIPEDEIYVSRNYVLQILIIANLLLFLAIFLLISALLQRIVIRGINIINRSLMKIAQGELNETVDVKSTEEFSELSEGINSMVHALKTSIEREKSRMIAELNLARTIQMSVLPGNSLETGNIRLHASMAAAKEIGGDFYDFFSIDTNKLVLIVADVSGKGMTAALFMMNSKAMLKDMLLSGMELSEAVTKANKRFCERNSAQMFITAFVAMFDLDKHTLSCVNAGHNPQLIKHVGSEWQYLKLHPSIPLAVRNTVNYKVETVPFNRGDKLFLYTDGVTEAQNPKHELFGYERLKNILNVNDDSPETAIEELSNELRRFADGEPQSDDITMLALDFKKK